MTKFSFAGNKCIRTDVREYQWTQGHRDMLLQIHNSGSGLEFRDNLLDYKAEIDLCKNLESMGLVHLAHSTYYQCWRVTEDGRKAVEDCSWEVLARRWTPPSKDA